MSSRACSLPCESLLAAAPDGQDKLREVGWAFDLEEGGQYLRRVADRTRATPENLPQESAEYAQVREGLRRFLLYRLSNEYGFEAVLLPEESSLARGMVPVYVFAGGARIE